MSERKKPDMDRVYFYLLVAFIFMGAFVTMVLRSQR